MEGQTPLPPVDGLNPPPASTVCAWCPKPATTEVEVEPAIKGKGRHATVLKRKAITAPACRACAERLENRKAEAKQAKR